MNNFVQLKCDAFLLDLSLCEFRLFTYILVFCIYQDLLVTVKGIVYKLPKGSFISSLDSFRFKISKQNIINCLKSLQAKGFITKKSAIDFIYNDQVSHAIGFGEIPYLFNHISESKFNQANVYLINNIENYRVFGNMHTINKKSRNKKKKYRAEEDMDYDNLPPNHPKSKYYPLFTKTNARVNGTEVKINPDYPDPKMTNPLYHCWKCDYEMAEKLGVSPYECIYLDFMHISVRFGDIEFLD